MRLLCMFGRSTFTDGIGVNSLQLHIVPTSIVYNATIQQWAWIFLLYFLGMFACSYKRERRKFRWCNCWNHIQPTANRLYKRAKKTTELKSFIQQTKTKWIITMRQYLFFEKIVLHAYNVHKNVQFDNVLLRILTTSIFTIHLLPYERLFLV